MKNNFKDLKVWKKSHELTLEIYKVTADFPKHEIYGITSQIRRAASSVPANIAEGYSRQTTKQYLNYLSISYGSLSETRYFIILAKDLNYINNEKYFDLEARCEEIAKMIYTITEKLNAK